ncbi:MAG: serine/threonine-protein kinase [Myxococcales bacterium]|nr:serine/threonine-protein kinase [Myxococcales bacterium]
MADARERYVFIKKLAEGGMADVFLARDAKNAPPRLCVVKQLLPNLRSKKEHVSMFLDEADLAIRLAHPNVVRALDRGSSREGPFLVLEYLAGFDLDLVIERLVSVGAQLPWPLAVQVIISSAEGMAYAHAVKGADGKPLNLVHRDLTPSNIFLTFDGVVKVLDFGIARAEERRTRTSTGMLKGKARYLAPELIQQLPADGRVDQFSLGAALYESLVLRPLFTGDNELAVIHAIMDGRRPVLREQRPDVPMEVDEVFRKMTSTLREERFSSMSEVAAALRAVMPPEDQRPALAAFIRQHFGNDFQAHASLMGRLVSASTSELRSYFEKGVNLVAALDDPSRMQKTVVAIGQSIPAEARRTPMAPTVLPAPLELPPDVPTDPGVSEPEEPVSAPLRLPDEASDAPPELPGPRKRTPAPRPPPPARSMWPFAIAAAIVALGLGGVWWRKGRVVAVPRGTLVVRSQPPGASIRLDGMAVQFRTPAALSDLPEGRHELILEHPDSVPTSVSAIVMGRQQNTLDVSLPSREGQLLFAVSPPEAVVTIDGREVALDGGTGASPPLPKGNHELEVRGIGYRPRLERFSIADGERKVIEVSLVPDPAAR